MKRLLLIIAIFTTVFGFSSPLYKSSVLFIAQDAGEAYAFLPVLKENHLNYYVVAGGVAYDIFKQEKDIAAGALISFEALGQPELMNRHVARDTIISDEILERVVSVFETEMVVAGVAFHFQGQYLKAFGELGVKTYALWDNFSPEGEDGYFTTAHRVKMEADVVIVPTVEFSTHEKFSQCKVALVEHPTIQVWKEAKNHLNQREIRHRYNATYKKLVTFIGGYGPAYERSFDLFVKGIESLGEDVKILVKPHPKAGGEYERMRLFAAGMHDCSVLGSSCEFTTQEIALASDLVVTYASTVGVQATLSGQSSLFVVPEGDTYTNFVIRLGLGRVARNAGEVRSAIHSHNEHDKNSTTIGAVERGFGDFLINASTSR